MSSSSSDDASSEASSDEDSDEGGARLTGYDELAGGAAGGLLQMPTLLEAPLTEPQDTLLDLEVRQVTFELESKDSVKRRGCFPSL